MKIMKLCHQKLIIVNKFQT